MATFFVGQRVRILFSNHWPQLAGQEGRIVRQANGRVDVYGVRGAWVVAPQCWNSEYPPYGAGHFAPHESQLEPILPEGHRAGDFSFSELMDKCREGEGIPA